MNFGALPVVLKAATSETVSATLGHSALVAGLGAGIAGLVLVLLYVLLYYRGLGLVVISGLVLTAMSLWAIISALGHTTVAPSFDLAGHHGPDRVHRHHGGLVHRLLRTIEGRDQIGPLRPHVGGPRLQERLAHGVGRRLRVAAGGDRVVSRRGRQREGLRLLPRSLHHHGHGDHVVLHAAARDPPRTERTDAGEREIQHRHRPRCRAADAGRCRAPSAGAGANVPVGAAAGGGS